MTLQSSYTQLATALTQVDRTLGAMAALFEKRGSLTDGQRADLTMLGHLRKTAAGLKARIEAAQAPALSELRDISATLDGKLAPFLEQTRLANLRALKKGILNTDPGIGPADAKAENACLEGLRTAQTALSARLETAVAAMLAAPEAPVPDFRIEPPLDSDAVSGQAALGWGDLAEVAKLPDSEG